MEKNPNSNYPPAANQNVVLYLCAVFYWSEQSAVNLNNKMTILLNNEKT